MARRSIQANGRRYLFSPDDEPPLGSRWWGLVRGRVINDVTEAPVTEAVTIESDLERAAPRIATDGLIGLAVIPRYVFPTLAGRNYQLRLTIHAAGYVSRTLSIVIPNDQRMTAAPLPQAGDGVLRLNDTSRLAAGELLMVGNPVTHPGSRFEQVRIAALGPAPGQVTIRGALALDHNAAGPEPVVPVVPMNFAALDLGDVRLVPQP
jgi:hypothetical protein